MYFYRLFRLAVDGATLYIKSGITFVIQCTLSVTGAATFTGTTTLPSATILGGSKIYTCNGIANSVTPSRKGDLCIDYSGAKLYVAGAATATTDWKLVTSA